MQNKQKCVYLVSTLYLVGCLAQDNLKSDLLFYILQENKVQKINFEFNQRQT